MLKRIRELQEENRRLREALAFTITERYEALNKCVERMHLVTYTSEKMQRHGLELCKPIEQGKEDQ